MLRKLILVIIVFVLMISLVGCYGDRGEVYTKDEWEQEKKDRVTKTLFDRKDITECTLDELVEYMYAGFMGYNATKSVIVNTRLLLEILERIKAIEYKITIMNN